MLIKRNEHMKKMKVEIWSDVTCTHCYTSKRKLETALSQFKDRDKVEIIWKSFELAPGLITNPEKKLPRFLAELQGISLSEATAMTDHVTNMVKDVGLEYDLNIAIPANSFNAHRLLHFAKEHQMQNNMEEILFKAYFSEGQNIDDIPTLIRLALEAGLNATETKDMLESAKYTDSVIKDISEAREAGIKSIPHFVFNNNTRLSGAQENAVFAETLDRTFAQWQLEDHAAGSDIIEGQSCTIGEDCI